MPVRKKKPADTQEKPEPKPKRKRGRPKSTEEGMAHRPKPSRQFTLSQKSKVEDINPQQYEQGFNMWRNSMSIAQILVSTGMTRPQFIYITNHPLPGYEDTCPSYSKRFADLSSAMQSRAQEAAEKLSEDAPKALSRMADIARAASDITRVILAQIMSDLKENHAADPARRKPLKMLMMNSHTRQTLNTLSRFTDYSKVAEAFRKVYDNPYQKNDPLTGMDKRTRMDISAEMGLPAIVATMRDVREHQAQGEEDYHQRLFRDFESWTPEELERYIHDGGLPDREYVDTGIEVLPALPPASDGEDPVDA